MGPTPFYGARAEKNPFAIKQTNICRLSGDIMMKPLNDIVTASHRFQRQRERVAGIRHIIVDATTALVVQMTGDDSSERHLSNATRNAAAPLPGEWIVDVAVSCCLPVVS